MHTTSSARARDCTNGVPLMRQSGPSLHNNNLPQPPYCLPSGTPQSMLLYPESNTFPGGVVGLHASMGNASASHTIPSRQTAGTIISPIQRRHLYQNLNVNDPPSVAVAAYAPDNNSPNTLIRMGAGYHRLAPGHVVPAPHGNTAHVWRRHYNGPAPPPSACHPSPLQHFNDPARLQQQPTLVPHGRPHSANSIHQVAAVSAVLTMRLIRADGGVDCRLSMRQRVFDGLCASDYY